MTVPTGISICWHHVEESSRNPLVRSIFSFSPCNTVRSLYKRQLIRLNMKKTWPTRTGMEDSRPIFFCKRFSYNENALYLIVLEATVWGSR